MSAADDVYAHYSQDLAPDIARIFREMDIQDIQREAGYGGSQVMYIRCGGSQPEP